MALMTRRKLLTAIAQLSAVTALNACGLGDETGLPAEAQSSDREILASVTFDLFPHPSLPPEIYVQIADTLLALNNPLLSSGLVQLKDLAKGKAWLALTEKEQITILTEVQESDFFALLRTTTIAALYKDPELYELTGYGGSAIEFGGYLNRGFDDISWLPQQEEKQ